MNDLKRSKRKMCNKQNTMKNTYEAEVIVEMEELDRGCKCKNPTNNTSRSEERRVGKEC